MAINQIGISKTAETQFTRNVFNNFLSDGNQLRKVLGTKFKVVTKTAEKIRFLITAEVIASEKPATGSTVTQSKGSSISSVYVKPKTYVVATYLDELDMDATGVNLSAEIEQIHSRALGLKTDEIILKAIADNNYDAEHKVNIDLKAYEGEILELTGKLAGIGRGVKKYLIVDSAAHKELLANEKFINGDYGTSGPVPTGSLDGLTRLGMEIVLLEDINAKFHGKSSLMEKVTGKTDKAYVVMEGSLCAGLNFADTKSHVDQVPTHYYNYLIQTHLSLGVEVLTERGLWEITRK